MFLIGVESTWKKSSDGEEGRFDGIVLSERGDSPLRRRVRFPDLSSSTRFRIWIKA